MYHHKYSIKNQSILVQNINNAIEYLVYYEDDVLMMNKDLTMHRLTLI